jgi:hypothetical protein
VTDLLADPQASPSGDITFPREPLDEGPYGTRPPSARIDEPPGRS